MGREQKIKNRVFKSGVKQLIKFSIQSSYVSELYWRPRLNNDYNNAIKNVKTFLEVPAFLQGNLRYRKDYIDIWDIPEVAYSKGYGDCDEFAVMAYDILKRLGIPTKILTVFTIGGGHMVCVYRYKGKLNHMGNWGNYTVMVDTIEQLIDTIYKDWLIAFLIDKEPRERYKIKDIIERR